MRPIRLDQTQHTQLGQLLLLLPNSVSICINAEGENIQHSLSYSSGFAQGHAGIHAALHVVLHNSNAR